MKETKIALPPCSRRLWQVALCLFALQAAALIAYNIHQWRNYDLGSDFATFYQAWQQIGTGHLDPRLSSFAFNYPRYGYPFWQSHLELIMWPLALLEPLFRASVVLLIVQDLVLSACGLVTLRWGIEAIERRRLISSQNKVILGTGLLLVILLNPWTYWTAVHDFHLQPFACLFTLLAGRAIWAGRRRAAWWILLDLACGDVAATYVVALGVWAFLAGRRHGRGRDAQHSWVVGLVLVGLGALALGLVSVVGSGKGSGLSSNYAYLAGRRTIGTGLSGIVAISSGIIRHPGIGWHTLWMRRQELFKFVAASGSFGVLSTIGLPFTAIVLLANGLNAVPNFISASAAFQSLVVVFFTALGGVSILAWLLARRVILANVIATALGLLMLGQALVVSAQWTSKSRVQVPVPATIARQLDVVRRQVPSGAEVIVSQGVIGRFGNHRSVFPFLDTFADGQTVPVETATVVFVFTNAGIEGATPSQTARAADLVRHLPESRVLVGGAGVEAFIWHARSDQHSLTFSP